jgi:uncharacterized iron-regulated protein
MTAVSGAPPRPRRQEWTRTAPQGIVWVPFVPSSSFPPVLRSAPPRRRIAHLLLPLALGACAPAAGPAPVATPAADASARDHAFVARVGAGTRVSARGAAVSPGAMLDALAAADVVFLGEQHDDPATHRLQLAVLEELARRGRAVTLSLEMFERDVQPALDAYLAGRVSEADFLAGARPWPNYATDYRPLVELARARGWPVVAANVPRPYAAAVARGGLAALDTLPPARRAHAAADVRCPADAYRRKFAATMSGGGMHGAPAADTAAAAAMLERIYQAQCLKDETMAESVVGALARGRTVVHVTGAFHSDERLGTVSRVLRRRPEARVLVVSAIPMASPGLADLAELAARGDYVVVVPRADVEPR